MKIVTKYPEGIFSWVDLSARDVAVAKEFYSQLFGWSPVDTPLPGGGSYTNMMIDGHTVCGMGEMFEEDMPTVWTSYVNVADAEATTQAAEDAGGTILMAPMDVMDAGRMAIIQDPTGAVFGLWQPNTHIGAEIVNQYNSLVWNELATKDIEAARDFYAATFGWDFSVDESGAGGLGYTSVIANGRSSAGMMQMGEEWGEMPSNWSVYFMVEDLEASIARATSLGATIVMPSTQAGDVGKFSILQDPQGAGFTIIQAEYADPPPGHEA